MIFKKISGFVLALVFLLSFGFNFTHAQSTCLDLTSNLKVGSTDSSTSGDVTQLQDFLYQGGYLSNSPTGYFGLATKKAVASYQKSLGLTGSGVVGSYTKKAIYSNSCQTAKKGSGPDVIVKPIDIPPVIQPVSTTTPSITITSPNGGEIYSPGQTISVNWKASNIPAGAVASISLNLYDSNNNEITSFTDASNASFSIDNITTHSITLPSLSMLSSAGAVFGQHFKVSMGVALNTQKMVVDFSDSLFTIIPATSTPIQPISEFQIPANGQIIDNGVSVIDQGNYADHSLILLGSFAFIGNGTITDLRFKLDGTAGIQVLSSVSDGSKEIYIDKSDYSIGYYAKVNDPNNITMPSNIAGINLFAVNGSTTVNVYAYLNTGYIGKTIGVDLLSYTTSDGLIHSVTTALNPRIITGINNTASTTPNATSTVQSYTVSFNSNGYATTPNPMVVNQGSSIALPALASTPNNLFTGWWISPTNCNGGACSSVFSGGASYTPTANVTLYAIWTTITTPSSASDSTPRIAYWWGKVNQHVDSNGNWLTDPDGKSGANLDKLAYCQKFWPNTVSVSSYKTENITTWQGAGNAGGPYTNLVATDMCVQGSNPTSPNTEINPIVPKTVNPAKSGKVLGISSYQFVRSLTFSMRGDDVKMLQKFLNTQGYNVSESGYYGQDTKNAVIKFQEAHKDEILTKAGLESGTGDFYTSTLNFVNKLLLNSSINL
ncbi:MAG: peptidoglycan-binding protein [Candidatus Nomurabacteria bacterium]